MADALHRSGFRVDDLHVVDAELWRGDILPQLQLEGLATRMRFMAGVKALQAARTAPAGGGAAAAAATTTTEAKAGAGAEAAAGAAAGQTAGAAAGHMRNRHIPTVRGETA